jgi:hypothetical protein
MILLIPRCWNDCSIPFSTPRFFKCLTGCEMFWIEVSVPACNCYVPSARLKQSNNTLWCLWHRWLSLPLFSKQHELRSQRRQRFPNIGSIMYKTRMSHGHSEKFSCMAFPLQLSATRALTLTFRIRFCNEFQPLATKLPNAVSVRWIYPGWKSDCWLALW